MRYGYWIDAVLGAILIVAPYVGNFMQDHRGAYTEAIVGVLLLAWALANSLNPGHQSAHGAPPTRA